MLKLMIFGRRASGKTRRAAQDHLKLVHGPMVVCPPPDSGAMPTRYVQNHVIDGVYSGSGAYGIDRDLVTELWFEDFDHLRASTATEYYLDKLKLDEPRFVDNCSVEKLLVHPEVIIEGECGIYKAFFAVASSAHRNEITEALDQWVKSARGVGGAVRNMVLPAPDGSEPFVSLVYEIWFATSDDAYALMDGFADLMPIGAACDFALVAEQYDALRLNGLFENAQ